MFVLIVIYYLCAVEASNDTMCKKLDKSFLTWFRTRKNTKPEIETEDSRQAALGRRKTLRQFLETVRPLENVPFQRETVAEYRLNRSSWGLVTLNSSTHSHFSSASLHWDARLMPTIGRFSYNAFGSPQPRIWQLYQSSKLSSTRPKLDPIQCWISSSALPTAQQQLVRAEKLNC